VSDQYEIETLADIEQIPVEKIDAFLIDLKNWLEMRRDAREMDRSFKQLFGSSSSLVSIGDSMTWVDDGKHDAEIHVNVRQKGSTK
jgi:hypothetical protein